MADVRVEASHRRTTRRRVDDVVTIIVGALFVVLFGAGLFAISQDGHPLSIVDEHIHFDTAAKATHGEIPYRGSLLGPELIDEWACGVGHEAGATSLPCGDSNLSADSIPSGRYSTGYIHYPTFFFAAAGFQGLWEAVTADSSLLNGFRAFSALLMTLGVIVAGAFAWLLGLRGARLISVSALPVASSMMVVTGIAVNPTSASVLTGALVAGTGLLWLKRDRGFVWFALAVAVSSAVAVTSSLPAGGFLIAMLVVLAGRRRWPELGSGWNPRWWQLGVISALVLVPVLAWGRIISARATIGNDVLYGFIPPAGKRDIIAGAIQELATLHTPWRETMGIRADADTFPSRVVQAFSFGGPTWITALVFGGLVVIIVLAIGSRSVSPSGERATEIDSARTRESWQSPLLLIVIGTLATVVLYPPALRLMNWLNFGFDHPIVERYSSALAPLLAFLIVMLVRNVVFSRSLAVIAVLVALGTVAGAGSL